LASRSFQRRLAEERTTFRRLVRDHRRSIAEALMKNRSTTVTSVAHTVGDAETARALASLQELDRQLSAKLRPRDPGARFRPFLTGAPRSRCRTWDERISPNLDRESDRI
jgi:hypothetical protein